MNIAGGQNLCGVAGGAGVMFDSRIADSVGQVDYTGFRIDNVIKELKLTVQRTPVGGLTASPTDNLELRQSLNLNLYGISRKRVIPTSSGIVVQYV